jgi:hypothetical protein
MKNKRLLLIIFSSLLLLLLPLVAMQFTNDVNWIAFDFIVSGVLLVGFGSIIELTLRLIKKPKYRLIICVALFIFLILIWAELAVGIFGTTIGGN